MIETELKWFAARGFRVAFDAYGLVAATPTAQPNRPYLHGIDVTLQREGRPVSGNALPAVIDTDEVEQRWVAAGTATVDIRHSFVAGWRTRIVVGNTAGSAWTGTLRVAVRAGDGHRLWCIATGSAAALALLPDEPDVPILFARTVGASGIRAAEADVATFQVGPHRYTEGERLVLAFDWASVRDQRRLAAEISVAAPALPRWSTVETGAEIWLPADPDTALAAPVEVSASDLGDRQAVVAADSGRHQVELRSARGATVLDLSWVTPVSDFLVGAAARALSAPPGPAGVVRLPNLATALVVQHVARATGFVAAAVAADALDQFTARFDDDGPDPSLRAVYLAGEYDRLGDPELITRAAELTRRSATAVPGLGLAVVRTAVAAALAGQADRPSPLGPAVTGPVGLAELELLLTTRPPELLLGDPTAAAALHRLGVELLAGLPGRLPRDRPADDLAYALLVLRLTPEALGAWWRRRFGCSIAELADARALEISERLASTSTISTAHAWLALTP